MQRSNWCVAALVGVFGLTVLVGPAMAAMVFTETWNSETVGDNANQLTAWQYESDYGDGPATDAMIAADAGWPYGNFLMLNPPNPPPYGAGSSMGIRTKNGFSVGTAGNVLSVKSKVALNAGDGGGAGVIGFAQAGNPLNAYGLAISREDKQGGGYNAVVEIFEFNNQLDGMGYGYQIVSVDPTDSSNVHTFMLQATIGASAIDFDVFVDDNPVAGLSHSDSTPVVFNGGVLFSLASNLGQHAFFDDFAADQEPVPIPEPSTFFIFAVFAALGMALLGRQARKKLG